MPPIAVDLEHDRLAHREARLARAVGILETRVRDMHAASRPVPRPLVLALRSFRADLDDIRARRLSVR
jgi:hypothetical protein